MIIVTEEGVISYDLMTRVPPRPDTGTQSDAIERSNK